MTSPTASKTIATHLQPGTSTFELAITCEVFGASRPDLTVARCDFLVCASADDRAAQRTWAMSIDSVQGLDRPADADLVIVVWEGIGSAPPEPVVKARRQAHGRGVRVASLCSGAFPLGHGGLLDGRRATNRWRDVDALAARFPDAKVDPDVLYVDEDPVFTSAGTAVGPDRCGHLVRLGHGVDVAIKSSPGWSSPRDATGRGPSSSRRRRRPGPIRRLSCPTRPSSTWSGHHRSKTGPGRPA